MAQFRKLLLVFSAFAMFAVVFNNSSAYADEFRLGIIVDPSYTLQSKQEFINGFQLAVDQSPDISHPEGVEGGNHLGGIDVDIINLDISNTGEDLVSKSSETAKNSDIIIADLQLENLNLVYDLITASNTYLLSMRNNKDVDIKDSTYFYGISPLQDTQSLLVSRAKLFSEEYVRKYGSTPTPDAELGYIAGRLIDLAVEATSNDPTDVTTMTNELNKVLGTSEDFVENPTIQNAEIPQQDQNNTETVPDKNYSYIRYLALAISASIVILVIFNLYRRIVKK